MLPLLLSLLAHAAPETPVTLVGTLGAAAGPRASYGGFGQGRLLFHVGPITVDLAGSEGVAANDTRMLGSVGFGVRGWLNEIFYARGGFLHHHETPWATVQEAPFLSAIGSAEGIRHRSGLDLGAGMDWPIPEPILDERLGGVVDLSVGLFPDRLGPPAYLLLQFGLSLDVGRRRP